MPPAEQRGNEWAAAIRLLVSKFTLFMVPTAALGVITISYPMMYGLCDPRPWTFPAAAAFGICFGLSLLGGSPVLTQQLTSATDGVVFSLSRTAHLAVPLWLLHPPGALPRVLVHSEFFCVHIAE